ncbi:methylase of polypeptide subunit release factors [Bradyrhizobium sp. GM22.5]
MTLRIGTKDDFARVRRWLDQLDFREKTIVDLLRIPNMSRLPDADSSNVTGGTPALRAAMALFIDGSTVPTALVASACDAATLASLGALDLVRDAPKGGVTCPVWLYPTNGFFVASDRQRRPDAERSVELVFPAHDPGTLSLLKLLPDTRAGDALDLCAGTGIGALHLARAGANATSLDITARAAHFADFNAQLNGLRIENLRGDLFAPVQGRAFDLICAHPPWVPSLGDGAVFREGGDIGEELVARLVADLPQHLRPGGTAILMCMGRDGRDASFEQRLRGWLGEAGATCDIMLGVMRTMSIDEFASSLQRLHFRDDQDRAERLAQRFRDLQTEKFMYGATFIRRTGTPVREPPLRLRMTGAATNADFERILAWRTFRRTSAFADWLSATKPQLPSALTMTMQHTVRGGRMVPDNARFISNGALSTSIQLDVWTAQLLSQFDGQLTAVDAFKAAERTGGLPAECTWPILADLIGQMAERGIIEIHAPAGNPNPGS